MSWFKCDDQLHGHPKARDAGLEAMGLWVVAGTYSAAYKLDGFIPAHYVASWPKGRTLARNLVGPVLWHVNSPDLVCECLPAGADLTKPGWWMHDYQDYNPTADEVEKDREAARERQRRRREKRRTSQDQLPDETEPK